MSIELTAEQARDNSEMDKLERYRNIVVRLIREYASCKPSNGRIDTEAIVDRHSAGL